MYRNLYENTGPGIDILLFVNRSLEVVSGGHRRSIKSIH